ncbi:MAG: prolipoprotein diacylglyceryl transferase [Candidatus Peribacteraceae bacterium]|nr:prolipoprotein diacylglyceryl transferase [Candidatus Peribacteraceae bacterium]
MFEAFQFGPVIIWMRVVFLMLAIVMSAEFFFRLSKSAGLSLQSLKDHAWLHALAFFLGGRILAVIANYPSYVSNLLRIVDLRDGGFSFIGGALGVGTVIFFTTRNQRTTFLQWMDVLLPAATFGLFFDWFGMFLSAQAYGKPANVFWAVTLNTYDVRYTVPIHPVQMYYALFYLALTFSLLLIRKYSRRAGSETLVGIIAASIGVFLFEFFRGDVGIPVFAKLPDFAFLACLIGSLGVLAMLEERLTQRVNTLYGVTIGVLTLAYVFSRSWIDFPQYQLRFSQVLAVLALVAAVVYVVVHRWKYPHL